ncbi:GLPGLI family protein [uncultured Chryseobacterium sp.]|uniref:GLPGLI family protein n=1 Tax=uncultured Chryseobacterium sp. TaxID=259322 RepID=UPI00262AF6E7|nr:GLPGLI family protein [uncultured Chryseobacterium sp.]
MKVLIALLLSNFFLAQVKFEPDFVATYNVEYPIYEKKNTEQFILFIDSKQEKSFYKSSNQYALDSLKKNGKIAESDFRTISSYRTALNEDVLSNGQNFTVFKTIVGAKLKYIEKSDIKWNILNDRRDYFGYKTRKAYAFAYGRKWIAWYAEDLPLNFGPYKFQGLPGLIINMYDEKAEYFLTLSQFKKKKMNVTLPNSKSYKTVEKAKIRDVEYNTFVDLNTNVRVFDSDQERREALENIKKRIRREPYLDLDLKPL